MEAEMNEMANIEHEYSATAHAQRVQNRLDIEAGAYTRPLLSST
jgi:hypothetical protein